MLNSLRNFINLRLSHADYQIGGMFGSSRSTNPPVVSNATSASAIGWATQGTSQIGALQQLITNITPYWHDLIERPLGPCLTARSDGRILYSCMREGDILPPRDLRFLQDDERIIELDDDHDFLDWCAERDFARMNTDHYSMWWITPATDDAAFEFRMRWC